MKSEMQTFDGLDNRREVMVLLQRLGSDRLRAEFLESLIPKSLCGFADCPMKVRGPCDPVAAYFMLVGVCNELGVPISEATRRLERVVSKHDGLARRLGRPDDVLAVRRVLRDL